MSNQAEQITQAKMDELIKNPYQLLEERVLELETERDEINQKLDRVAEILVAIRNTWANVIPNGGIPVPSEIVEDGEDTTD